MWGLENPGHLQPNDYNGGVSLSCKCHLTVTAWHHCPFPTGTMFISWWPLRTQLTVLLHSAACVCTQHQGSSTRLHMARFSLGCRRAWLQLWKEGGLILAHCWCMKKQDFLFMGLHLCHLPLSLLLPIYSPLGQRLETCIQNGYILWKVIPNFVSGT